MSVTFSDDYIAQREALFDAELELRAQIERVAEMRRGLPLDTKIDDYVLAEGPRDLDAGGDARPVRLSELFSAPDRTLVTYHLMYGKAQTDPCPMCTMWCDGLDAVAPHLEQRVDFAIVAAADVADLRAHARSRGWRNARLVSAADSSFKRDLGSEVEDGGQEPLISVFKLADDGSVRLFYSGSASIRDTQERGIDLLTPVWNLLDLTPEGRGKDWYPSLAY